MTAPAETMIERVARAIASEDINLASAFSGVGSINQQHRERELAFNMARAAIEAMREPTKAMIEAAGDWWYATLHNVKDRGENGAIIFRAAIDAALKDES